MAVALPVFDLSTISDQKRLVRGEQLLLARKFLRVRDQSHNKPWRVFMLPGNAPYEEIQALRELMPKCHITAVDRDQDALLSAIDCEADEVIHCDLVDFEPQKRSGYYGPAAPISELEKFDLVILDLCANVNESTKRIVRTYRNILSPNGVMIFNFSFGRDVREVFDHVVESRASEDRIKVLISEIPKMILGRIVYLLTRPMIDSLHSVMTYRGNKMPMCSILFAFGAFKNGAPVQYLQVEPGDFEIAVTNPDPSLMYACPKERILELRRKHAAIKAAYTKKQGKQ